MKLWNVPVAALILLQGCATMSVDECAVADWRAIGYDDGASGETLSKAQKREAACAKHGYAMDHSAYDQGRFDGLAVYCTPSTGYGLGELGRDYNGVCADHNEVAFLDAYNRGREMYSFTSAVAAAKSQLASVKRRHNELDSKLNKYWGGYREEEMSAEQHNTMVLGLWAERKYLREEAIPYWNYAHRYLGEQLDEYKVKVAARDPAVGSLEPRKFPGPERYTGPTKQDAQEMLREVFSSLSN